MRNHATPIMVQSTPCCIMGLGSSRKGSKFRSAQHYLGPLIDSRRVGVDDRTNVVQNARKLYPAEVLGIEKDSGLCIELTTKVTHGNGGETTVLCYGCSPAKMGGKILHNRGI